MHCPKFILHIMTEPDGKTFCPIRLLALIGFFQFFIMNAINYRQHGTFDPQAFALGFGTMIAGAGVALGLKKDAPKQDDDPKQ